MKPLSKFGTANSYKLWGTLFASCLTTFASTAAANDEIVRGKVVYDSMGACGACHGPSGEGDGAAAASLNPKPRKFSSGDYAYDTDGDGKKGTETDIYNIITNGAQKYGGSMLMAGRADLPEADRKALAKYVFSLKK